MIVLVTASRTWTDIAYIEWVLDGLLDRHGEITLYHGACGKGGDAIADRWGTRCRRQGKPVTVVRMPAPWRDDAGRRYKRAGLRRNDDMVAAVLAAMRATGQAAEAHAFIRDKSPGTTHCAAAAQRAGLHVTRHRWETLHPEQEALL